VGLEDGDGVVAGGLEEKEKKKEQGKFHVWKFLH